MTVDESSRMALRALFAGQWTVGGLVRFHTAHKLMLLAHSPAGYARLGRLVARAGTLPRSGVERDYAQAFERALAAGSTPARHVNVLQHMAGYFRECLDPALRCELAAAIDDYRRQRVPLAVPLALVRRRVRALGIVYLEGQRYLDWA